jgi:carbamoyl-phosphate synthase small subunit
VFYGFGATGQTVAELCFNTAMTGYQEIMTDPSYAGQIVTFTFPHIGNVGVNPEDDETADPGGRRAWWSNGTRPNRRTGARPSDLSDWLAARAGSASAGSTRGA